MEKPMVAAIVPIGVDLEPGKSYWWCSCGLSKNQPLCDGSHKGTGFTPFECKTETRVRRWFCTCKATKNPPHCDGAHTRL